MIKWHRVLSTLLLICLFSARLQPKCFFLEPYNLQPLLHQMAQLWFLFFPQFASLDLFGCFFESIIVLGKVLFWQFNGIILLLAGYSSTGRTKLNFQGAHLVPWHGQSLYCSRCIMGTVVCPICIVDPQTSNWSQSFHKGPWRLKHFPS